MFHLPFPFKLAKPVVTKHTWGQALLPYAYIFQKDQTRHWRACVHAQLLQSCLTLCDPMDCCPPGSFDHGILQARMMELGCQCPLQGIFPTQGLNPCLSFLYWQVDHWTIRKPHWRAQQTFKSWNWDFPGVQWLRLHTPSAGGLGLIPGQGTRPCALQQKPAAAKEMHNKIAETNSKGKY